MKRRLLSLLTALSLLACVAAAVLCVRSYTWLHGAAVSFGVRPGEVRYLLLYSGRGGIQLSLGHTVQDVDLTATRSAGRFGFFHWTEDDPEPPGGPQPREVVAYRHEAWGFGADRLSLVTRLSLAEDGNLYDVTMGPSPDGRTTTTQTATRAESCRRLWFPYWVPVLALAVLPFRWLVHDLRRRRARERVERGLCPDCGYDLRGGGDANFCPECGTTKGAA